MHEDLAHKLLALRRRTEAINSSLMEDLKPFLNSDGLTFRRLPGSTGPLNVTTTCSCLMALITSRHFIEFYEDKTIIDQEEAVRTKVEAAFTSIVAADWKSSKLKEKNAFTTTVVLRAAGILKKHNALPSGALPHEIKHKKQTLGRISIDFAKNSPESFSVENYPSTPAIGYWFIEAIDHLNIELKDDVWVKITEWVSKVFSKQLSLVSSHHDAMMDPVEMGMAACLAARLHRIAAKPTFNVRDDVTSELPSLIELQHAVRMVFEFQGNSGIWPKYFPLFHYPDVGANYCFSFELLEAIVHEFAGTDLLEEAPVLQGIEKAVTWCEDNRFEYYFKGDLYRGWNSGGQLNTLSKGIPESWATAVVHMFLYRLRHALSEMIESHTLERYGVRRLYPPRKDSSKWDSLIDSPVWLPGNKETTVKKLVQEQIINPIESSGDKFLHYSPLKQRRSALLFGPPGTSKTTLVRAIARKIGWPLVELNPSHFLRHGLENIYTRADEIFNELLNLSHVVVMFDEMDALAQRRVERLDITRQFLTTSMLPKLATLHDHARVIFFMATNHQRNFDEAIKRPGRFDLLICMGPSRWEEKLEGLKELWVGPGGSNDDVKRVREILNSWIGERDRDQLRNLLDLFTFGEMQELFEYLRDGGSLRTAIENMNDRDFRTQVEDWGKNYITLREIRDVEETIRDEYEQDKRSSHIQ